MLIGLSGVFLFAIEVGIAIAIRQWRRNRQKGHDIPGAGPLGVVFGDIGTSPHYSFQTALWSVRIPDQSFVLGIASLIIWCLLLLLVTVKYMFVVMCADYHGEGGRNYGRWRCGFAHRIF
jgi:K+ transporter